MTLKKLKEALKTLQKQVAEYEGKDERNCYDSECAENCMYGASGNEQIECYNEGCRHWEDTIFGNCKRLIHLGGKEVKKRTVQCCGFKRKDLTCKSN
jgi:hypothetical protein